MKVALLVILLSSSLIASTSSAKSIDALYSNNKQTRDEAIKELQQRGSVVAPELKKVVCDRKHAGFDSAWPEAAKLLGEWRYAEASHCLASLLGYSYYSYHSAMQDQEVRLETDPAYKALIEIGNPAVPAIRQAGKPPTPADRRCGCGYHIIKT